MRVDNELGYFESFEKLNSVSWFLGMLNPFKHSYLISNATSIRISQFLNLQVAWCIAATQRFSEWLSIHGAAFLNRTAAECDGKK